MSVFDWLVGSVFQGLILYVYDVSCHLCFILSCYLWMFCMYIVRIYIYACIYVYVYLYVCIYMYLYLYTYMLLSM